MNKKQIFSIFLLMLVWTSPSVAQQNEPLLLISWKADSLAPSYFKGKVFPTSNSLVFASVSLINNGKVVDLSNEIVYWYMNGDFIDGGAGITSVHFQVPNISTTGNIDLRVQLPEYIENDLLIKNVEVPIVVPEAIIEAPFPRGGFSGESVRVVARPFFFNVPRASSLVYKWEVNGVVPVNAENPDSLVIQLGQNITPGEEFSIALGASNPFQLFDAAIGKAFIYLR